MQGKPLYTLELSEGESDPHCYSRNLGRSNIEVDLRRYGINQARGPIKPSPNLGVFVSPVSAWSLTASAWPLGNLV